MRRLPKPAHDVATVFGVCISHIGDADLKSRLTAIAPAVVAAAATFEQRAQDCTLHVLPHANDIGAVTAAEMLATYRQRMAKKGSPGRGIYDELITIPRYGRCPLCSQRDVSTLDHHLPQSAFSTLVTVPINLVAACAQCNKVKLEAIPTCGEDHTMHPYFDDVEKDAWLYADVLNESPAALRFFVNPPASWTTRLQARVKHHFEFFRLKELYGSHAAEELVSVRHQLTTLHPTAGMNGIRAHLSQLKQGHEASYMNSWQSAMYRGLLDSQWYCEEGFALEG